MLAWDQEPLAPKVRYDMTDAIPHPSAGFADRHLDAELRLAEYNSVRVEWLSSRDAQQHTLQWTLAALAVLLAGLVGSHVGVERPFVYVALASVGVVVATCSQGIWFGEVMRMERAALYLRGIEAALASQPRPSDTLPPLMWETWRGVPKMAKERGEQGEKPPWISKASISIVSSFALYGLLSGAALTVLVDAAKKSAMPLGDRHFAIWAASVTGAIFLVANAYMCLEALRIRRESSRAARFTELSTLLDQAPGS